LTRSQIAIEAAQPASGGRPRVAIRLDGASATHGGSSLGVSEELVNSLCKQTRISGIDQETGKAILDQ
jgi:hypothetical protein